MRARHRHFNARDAGAVFVVDSRYITGLSDGNAVSTWSDRSRNGNNATQATAANQPTYQTAEQGGQPLVKFDGSNDTMSTATPVTTVTNNWALVSVAKTISGGRVHFSNGSNAGYAQTHDGEGAVEFGGLFGNVAWLQDGAAKTNQWIIQSMLRISGTTQIWANGATTGTTFANAPNTPSGATWLGADSVGRQNCEISTAAVINVSISVSLRRRIEHAAAFSFKIACS
jgi:hypothetical protein